MSISVDDLVASLSGSHIGQEAMDLAALQAQLAQTLFTQQISSNAIGKSTDMGGDGQLCNTPIARTPSSSFCFGHFGDRRSRSNSNAGPRSRSRKNSVADDHSWPVDEMDEDEQMVEDLLAPSSPIASPSFAYTPRSPQSSPFTYTSYNEASSGSSFTSTDPFYIAQVQASQNPQPTPHSLFTQSGRPAHTSPFLQHSYHQSPQYSQPIPMQR
jgi:hypothetical protein